MDNAPDSIELDVLPDRARGMLYIAGVPSAPTRTAGALLDGLGLAWLAMNSDGGPWMVPLYIGAFIFLGLMGLSVRELFRLPQALEFAHQHVEIGADRWLRSQVQSASASQPMPKKPIRLTLTANDGVHEWLADPFQHTLEDVVWVARTLQEGTLKLPESPDEAIKPSASPAQS